MLNYIQISNILNKKNFNFYRIRQGISNCNYRIIASDGDYFLRYYPNHNSISEIKNIKYAKDLAPNIINYASNYVLQEFLIKDEKIIRSYDIAYIQYKLHSLKAYINISTLDYNLLVENYTDKLKAKFFDLIIAMNVDQIKTNYAKVTPILRFCHHDLSLENLILSSNKLYVLDFENAGFGDIHIDICMLIINMKYNAEQIYKYIQIYNKISNLNLKIINIKLSLKLAFLICKLWALDKYNTRHQKKYFNLFYYYVNYEKKLCKDLL